MSRPFVKVCGVTRAEDARAAVDAGAEAIGFVLHPGSPRHVTPEQAAGLARELPPAVARVGVVVDAEAGFLVEAVRLIGLTAVQVHGTWTPEAAAAVGATPVKAFRTRAGWDETEAEPWREYAVLLDGHSPDAHGGTGKRADWSAARRLVDAGYRVLLAGGLGPDTVREAAETVRPTALDLNSGVEDAPGRKDAARIRAAMERLAELGPPDRRTWPW